jgi:ATP-dependent Clp protease ATP-binding subunit ClpB
VDFRNTVIIMTSNIGSEHILTESNPEQREALVLAALRGHFRPEFLNRIDETIIFDRLGEEDLAAIVKIQLGRVVKRLRAQGLEIELSPEAVDKLATEGYDPAYGARPLKRVIQHRLLDPLSLDLLDGKFKDGDTIHVGVSGSELTFAK